MSLKGLYVISDDHLTPSETIFKQVEEALKGGATIVQLRDKKSTEEVVKQKALKLQKICEDYGTMFVLNDKIDLACEIKTHGLHIGKSDHDKFDAIREKFDGIIGVSCYSDIEMAKDFEKKGADYVAFGSFFHSPTKPNSNIISLNILDEAKDKLHIPVCAIGGINTENIDLIAKRNPEMISVVSDIWSSDDIRKRAEYYSYYFKG